MVLDSMKAVHIFIIKKRQGEIFFLLSKRDTTLSPENSGGILSSPIPLEGKMKGKEADIGKISVND